MNEGEIRKPCDAAKEKQTEPNVLIQSYNAHVSGSQRNVCESPEWFAMSATFGRSLKAKEFLESNEVRCFVPMKYKMVTNRHNIKTRKLIPAIGNLLFAYTTKSNIQNLKRNIDYLHYLTKPQDGRNIPITVPQNQMQNFISVCETLDERLHYLTPDEIDLEKGTKVRIVGGGFDGVEGTFIKVKGSRKKKVMVLVQSVAAVIVTEFSEGYIQVLE